MGKGVGSTPKRETTNRFSKSEIKHMEKLFEEGKDELLDESFHQRLTDEFNRLPSRAGKKAIQMKQVQRWFKTRKSPPIEIIDLPNSSEELVHVIDTSLSLSAAPESSDIPEDTGKKDSKQEELEFEARSSRDNSRKQERMGKRVGSRLKQETANRFSKSEIRQMEKLLEEGKDELLDESFHQKLTEEFNSLPSRAGHKAIQMEQVQRWFQKRKTPATETTDAPNSSKELVHVTDTSLSISAAPESSDDMAGDTREKDPEQEELEFEARSSRDNAWYDVATFLAHRVLSSGEPEVRIRFHGFGAEDDEWVNIKKDVRERSIPLESSECHKVEVGDLVLCFQERSEQAMYFDAHVLELERKSHDVRGCRCRFLIHYDHDQTEERVSLKRLCRRPKY